MKVPRGGGVKRECGCRERQFQRFRWRFSYTLGMRPALSYGDMQSVVAFPVTQPLLLANGGGAAARSAHAWIRQCNATQIQCNKKQIGYLSAYRSAL